MSSIADIRKDYKLRSLAETDVAADAVAQFGRWWEEAVASQIDEVNAMTLATASADGVPSARIVLLKGYDEKGFTFFTNYESFKGQQLGENPRACLVFFWKELERQVRITGIIEKVSQKESEEYFISRPQGSRLGAWASPQSQVIPNREWLETKEAELKAIYGDNDVPKPPHWGGYRLKPIVVEFWQGRASRLHDRIQYTLQDEGAWKIERLAP
ncbi:pyridoxamine 5'-phosphate oxidase [Parasegetibacter sp. NRK P23]|uniref:pyridoxamine 5'-phosphate oxidase n=1 Tax=Parasegetibacter sp. NRK P23 TaxID=2942999 RepID=UPI0020441908|nr:pyridoxamine 5'-phosphate oxidase [Parasegetibacter sp. NRK P23]MCM5527799.1 pyridoxamine 5'-phosphate oxidase [Parasegetibacter sp. NRK P23]